METFLKLSPKNRMYYFVCTRNELQTNSQWVAKIPMYINRAMECYYIKRYIKLVPVPLNRFLDYCKK